MNQDYDEHLPLEGGPLDGLAETPSPDLYLEVPIAPCDDERLICIGRYKNYGDKYEYQGHYECGETIAERTARTVRLAFGDEDPDA